MSNNKLDWNDLPDELKSLFSEDDEIEYESFAEGVESYVLPVTDEQYREIKLASARKLIKHRRYVEEMKVLYEKYESGKLDGTQAEKLMKESRQRYEED